MTVRRTNQLSSRMVRITFTGPQLRGFEIHQPASSVRLLVPSPDATELTLPRWDRNNFVMPDGRRPTLRTITPRHADPDEPELDLDVVIHGDGPASQWAERAEPGMEAAMSGPARGYTIDPDATDFLLVGDETAIPAISQLLEVLPRERPVQVALEVSEPGARLELPQHPSASVRWNVQEDGLPPAGTLPAVVEDAPLTDGTRVWAAGEAAAMQRIRRHLFDERNVARSATWIRGYWKFGRAGDDTDADSA